MLVFIQQGADVLFGCRQIDMLNVMPGSHDAADRALIKVKHSLNHQALLRVKDLPVAVIGQHGSRFGVQLCIFFFTAQQAHNGVGRALTQGLISGKEATAVKYRQLVKRFNHDGETNGGVQIAFRNVEAKTVGHQAKANHQQEAQAEDHDGWVAVHKAGECLARHHHQRDGDNHRCHHNGQMVHHPDGGDHRIQGEDGIQHHDLRYHRPESRATSLGRVLAVFTFEPFIELYRGFEQQEQPAEEHDQIAGAKAEAVNGEQRLRECDHPGDRGQQQ